MNLAHAQRCLPGGSSQRSHEGGATPPTFDDFGPPISSNTFSTNSVCDFSACLERQLQSRRSIRHPAAPSQPQPWGPHRPRLYSRSLYNSRIATICPECRRAALSSRAVFSLLPGPRRFYTLRLPRGLFNYDVLRPRIIATRVGPYATISMLPRGRERSIATLHTSS